jgi:predicted enzyme related to lactoylglutathione lyase
MLSTWLNTWLDANVSGLGRARRKTRPSVYVMVDSVAATLDTMVASGGEIVQPIGADAPEITARFCDPAGNMIGL